MSDVHSVSVRAVPCHGGADLEVICSCGEVLKEYDAYTSAPLTELHQLAYDHRLDHCYKRDHRTSNDVLDQSRSHHG